MAIAFDEELARRLPLPLAQLYRRAHNAKSPLDRNLTAYFLWEAGLKLGAAVAVGVYAERHEEGGEAPECLANLVRASLGQWWEFLRTLAGVLAEYDEPFKVTHDLLQGRRLSDMPRAAGLDAVLRKDGEGDSAGSSISRATVQLGQLFDRLVNYRNKILHNPGVRRAEGFHEQMSGALLGGVSQIFGRFDPLAKRRLLFIGEVRRQASGGWLVERYELTGETARRVESLEMGEADTPRLPRPNRLYLQRLDVEGPAAAPTLLHPLVLFEPETTEVFFFNSLRKNERPEYLCYSSGKSKEVKELGPDLRELLARAMRQPITEMAASASKPPSHDSKTPEGPPPEDAETAAPRHIGEFELKSKLGQGGMGVVYRAWQPSLGREVALKCLLRAGDARAEARFAREIHALGSVEHPHLVKIFTSGADGDKWFYAMELLDGATLSSVVDKLSTVDSRLTEVDLPIWQDTLKTVCDETHQAEKPLRDSQAIALQDTMPAPAEHPKSQARVTRAYVRHMVALMRQVAEAAHALHQARVIHRDIKPGNIMVNQEGNQAVLMDLGLAQVADDIEGRLTRTRQFIGTLRYASPEQVLAVGTLDARSDVYSLGATLFEVLTLRPLYGATEQTAIPELMERIQHREPELLRKLQPAIPKDLEAIVQMSLEKERRKRYGSAQELADDLLRFLEGRPVLPRPVGKVGRFWRWCKRKPAIAGLSALLLLAVVVSFVGITWKWMEANHALEIAERATDDANQRGRELLDANDKLQAREHDLRSTNEQLEKRQKQLSDANRNLDDYATNVKNLNYSRSIALAHREWLTGNLAKWETLLNNTPPNSRDWDWQYLKQLGTSELFSLRNNRPQWTVAFSNDGLWLAHAGDNNRITIRKAANGEAVHRLPPEHKNRIHVVAFSPDSTLLASASMDKTVKVWDVVRGKVVLTFDKHQGEVHGVAFSPDGTRIASLSSDRTLKVWDLQGNIVFERPCAGNTFSGLAFHPQGRLLACPAEKDNGIAVWNIFTGEKEFDFKGHTLRVFGIAYSPNGRFIASTSLDATVKIWDTVLAERAKKDALLKPAAQVKSFNCNGFVSTVAFNPGGQRVAAAGWDQTVRLWDLQTGKETNCLRGHTHYVLGLAFSADGKYLASAGHDGSVKIWETDRNQELSHMVALGQDTPAYFHGVAYDPDGKHLFGCGNGGLYVWDAAANKLAWPMKMEGIWGSITVSSDGLYIGLGEGDQSTRPQKAGQVVVVDVAKRTIHKTFKGHTDWITGVAFRPGQHQLASAGKDGAIKVWDLNKDQPVAVLQHSRKTSTGRGTQPQRVWGIAYSGDGKYLASAGDDKKIVIWDAETTKDLLVLQEHTLPVRCLAFSRDGKFLVSGAGDTLTAGEIIIWDAQSWKMLHRLGNLAGSITGVALHPNGRLLAASSFNSWALIGNVLTGEEHMYIRGSSNPAVVGVAWDPNGRSLACADTIDIVVCSAAPSADLFSFHHSDQVNSAAFHPQGRLLASASDDSTVQIWDTLMGQPVGAPLEAVRSQVSNTIAWSPRGDLLAYDNGKSIRIRSWPEQQVLQNLEQDENVAFLTFNPQGTLLATALRNQRQIRLYDTATWKLQLSLQSDKNEPNSLSFSADGKLLAAGSKDKMVRIWEVAGDGQELHVLQGHKDSVSEVSFLDDRRLASSSKDATLRLWDAAAGKQLATLKGHVAPVWSVGYLPAEKKLVSVDEIGLIMVWNAETGEQLATLRGHAGAVGFVAGNPANSSFATNGSDGTVRLWTGRNLSDVSSLQRERERWQTWFRERAQVQAKKANWQQALADFRAAVEREPKDPKTWLEAALVALECGDKDYYREVCRFMLERFGPAEGNKPASNLLAVWACVQARDSGIEPIRLVEIAAGAVKQSPQYLYVYGGALYRAGRFEEALKVLNESKTLNDEKGDGNPFHVGMFLALVHSELGNEEEARNWLIKCKTALANGALSWDLRLHLGNLVREAELLIEKEK